MPSRWAPGAAALEGTDNLQEKVGLDASGVGSLGMGGKRCSCLGPTLTSGPLYHISGDGSSQGSSG